MKEVVISLLGETEDSRVDTYNRVKENLQSYVRDGSISIATREKFNYTKDENDMSACVTIKLENYDDKFIGAFNSWFAYRTAQVRMHDDIYEWPTRRFDVCLSILREVSCFAHRIKGLKKEGGYNGKIFVMLDSIHEWEYNNPKKGIELEPLSNHVKYIGKFSELNPYDF